MISSSFAFSISQLNYRDAQPILSSMTRPLDSKLIFSHHYIIISSLLGKPCGLDVVAFVTNTCLGVMQLPIDGNPNREYGVLGNPGGITGSASGQTKIITVGPGLISAWKIDETALDKQRIRGGLGMAPFYALLDEAEFKLLQDVFYFCQLETEV